MWVPNSTASAVVVVGHPLGRDQRRALGLGQQARLGRAGVAGTQGLGRGVQGDPLAPDQVVEPVVGEVRPAEGGEVLGQVVRHLRDRLASGTPQPHQLEDRAALVDLELLGHCAVGLDGFEGQHLRRGLATRTGQVVVERGELEGPPQLGLDDARTDAASAHDQALVDQVLHGPAHGRSREAHGRREVHLVLDQGADGDGARVDGVLEVLRDLEVERDRAAPVDGESTQGLS